MPQLYGTTKTGQQTRVADGVVQPVRLSATGEPLVIPLGGGAYVHGLEGSYFKAINSTFNTAVAMSIAAATAFSETQGSITIRNSNASGGKDIYLDYIKVVIAAAGTGNTNLVFALQIDNTVRYSSGGTALTINNCNSSIANTTGAVVHAGALTLASAGGSARKLTPGGITVKAAAPAANDIMIFNFGKVDTVAVAPGVAIVVPCGPVMLPGGANHTFVMHFYGASQSAAPTAFFEIGFIER